MIRLCMILATILSVGNVTNGQVRQFPYEARVVVDEAYVRSGGGEAFYPTTVLPRDSTVRVRRHDPGGWYMIDPPQESFSWIPSKYVQETGGGNGEVIESNVVVFVGSSFGDETHVWQRKMMAGEKLTILGQRQVDTHSGPKSMYKIAPPTREFRWVPGTSVVPIGEAARAQHDQNPYVVPSNVAEQMAQGPTSDNTTQLAPQNTSRFSPSQRLVKLKQIREEQRELQQVDQQFRSMILSDPAQWDLDSIEQSYLELQGKATFKPVAGQIDLRYPAISRYRQRKAELEELNRLTSETEKRDADLLATQFGFPTSGMSTDGMQNAISIDQPFPVDMPTEFLTDTNFMDVPATSSSVALAPPNSIGTGHYVGAGYVQRGAGDTESPYLLTSPDGKLLAHLKPNGTIDLEQYVGRSVGLTGKRWFDGSVKSDRIDVTGLEEVRIRN